jgi:hypothetical protein
MRTQSFDYLVPYYQEVLRQLKQRDSVSVHQNLSSIQNKLLDEMPDLNKRSFTNDALTVLKAFFRGLKII